MAWFRKEGKPRASRHRLKIPTDAWYKCTECGHMDIREKFDQALHTCPQCGHHRRYPAQGYIDLLTDPGTWRELFGGLRSVDQLRFDGYRETIERAEKKATPMDAVRTGQGLLAGSELSLAVMDFQFMGGSMGAVVGEKIGRLARCSLEREVPLVIVSASGGARMQEGVVSLMQMAKTSTMISALGRARLPFISILTNPTTGGVSASFAMQGDIILAEPGAVVGFAGPRVIKQTIGQDLPDGFQTAEFLLEHGMVDAVVPRARLAETTAALLGMMWPVNH